MDKKAIIMAHLEKQKRPISISWIAKDLKRIGFKSAKAILVEALKAGEVCMVMIPSTSIQYGFIHKNPFWYIERMCEECKVAKAHATIHQLPVPAPEYWATKWLCGICFGRLSPDHAPPMNAWYNEKNKPTRDYWQAKDDEATIQRAIDANTDQYS